MALTRAEKQRVSQWFQELPGKRGVDVPEHEYDRIFAVASGITLPLWGRPPSPQQMQHLWDNKITDPSAIHAAFGALPHPHAPNVSVSDFPAYAQAFKAHEEHSK